MPALMRVLRAVCEKDLALGLGYALTTCMAATNIWIAGSPSQKLQLADLLRDRAKVAIAYHEWDHGNDLVGTELSAVRVGDAFRLRGGKAVINNIARAHAFVLCARTDPSARARALSLFFVRREDLQGAYRFLPRVSTHGVRNCHISGIELIDCTIPARCLLGEVGAGLEYALRAFQVTRALLPGASLGIVETAYRLTMAHAQSRRLYGGTMLEIPHVRATLAQIRLELHMAYCLSNTIAGCLHVVPEQMSVYASLCKYHVPLTMRQVLKKLAEILGAYHYLCEGTTGLFEKIIRDYPVVSFGHAGSLVCQAAVASQLPAIFRKWNQSDVNVSLIRDMYDTDSLPCFDASRLSLTNSGRDILLNSVTLWQATLSAIRPISPAERLTLDALQTAVSKICRACEELVSEGHNRERESWRMVERYACLQSAIATFNAWAYSPDPCNMDDGLWIVECLNLSLSKLQGTEYDVPDTIQHFVFEHMSA
ncbi:hypothetical protein WM23_22345 [Burkholderia ubonensis]|nr:hypothetical protein WM23_22345 [Burkholderia ubonensis]